MYSKLLRILDNPIWDYSNTYESNEISGEMYYRYNNSIFVNPTCFTIATKSTSRGNGDARELMKRVIGLFDNMGTVIETFNGLKMQKFLLEFGFKWDSVCKEWSLKHTDTNRYNKLQYLQKIN
jgi:hypothetical protein